MKVCKLSDIAEVQTGPFGSQLHSEDYVEEGTPIVTVEHLGNRRFTIQNLPFVSNEDRERLSKYSLREGDIVFSRVGAVDRCSYVTSDENGWLFSGRCLRVRCHHECDALYLYYYFCSDSVKEYVRSKAVGATMLSLNTDLMLEIPIQFPQIKLQKEIAKTLSFLDSKIELNRQINDNLEAMAKQLYDYWFVQFDFPNEEGKPYKSSGGAMVYNERLKREVPIGWEVENLIDFAEIKNGATPSTADEANYGGDIVWITPKDLSDQQSKFVYQGERNITKQGFDSCSTSMLPTNSVLMSSRAPIGLVSIAKHEVCTNQGFKSFIPKSISDSIYLYYYIKHHIKQIEQLGTGTTFKEVSRDDLCKFPILTIGAKDIYVQWIELQNVIADKQLALTKEIAALTKQRDELLPLLMNGQASVNYHLSDD